MNRKRQRALAVVVTFNGHRYIERCLNSLLDEPVDVLVIDNASTDTTVEVARRTHPSADIVVMPDNLGFGRANNVGLKRSLEKAYDYAFLLNQDAYVTPGTIQALVDAHSQASDYALLAPVQLAADAESLDYRFSRYVVPPYCRRFFSDCYCRRERLDFVYDCEGTNAAAWLLPRKTLEYVGGFDPLFSHYAEDDDYSVRVRALAGRIGIVPRATVVHDRSSPFPRREDMLSESRMLARAILTAKKPSRSFPVGMAAALARLGLVVVSPSERRLLNRPIATVARTATRLLARATTIARHRARTRVPGPHFLTMSSADVVATTPERQAHGTR